jgi:hypothetical protein
MEEALRSLFSYQHQKEIEQKVMKNESTKKEHGQEKKAQP